MAKAKNVVVKIIPDETIFRKIYVLRGQKVMLDFDIAALYGVATKVLNQSINKTEYRKVSRRFYVSFDLKRMAYHAVTDCDRIIRRY